MATGGSTKSSQGRLICAICQETYHRPKLLPCYHTFCQACLESLAPPPAPTLACPKCRTNIVIPPGGATDFQSDIYMEEDLTKESSRSCDICSESRNAEYRCVECQQYYCSPCKSLHEKMAVSSRHNMLPFSGAAASQQDQRTLARKCSKHDFQREIFFCTVCDTTVCPHCKLISHEGHAVEEISDTATKARQELKEVETEIRKKIRQIEAEQADTERSREQLQTEHSYVDSMLKKRAEQVRNWLYQILEKSLSGATELNNAFEENLKQAQVDLRCKLATLSARAQHIDGVLLRDDNADVLKLLADLKARDTSDEAGQQMRPSVTALGSGDGQAENSSNFLLLCQEDNSTFRSTLQSYVGFVSSMAALRPQPVSSIQSSEAVEYARRPTTAPSPDDCGLPTAAGSSGICQSPPSIAGKSVATGPSADIFRHQPLPEDTHLNTFQCSSNPETLVTAIYLTTSNKLWVKCKPPAMASASMEMLKVFDINGRQLNSWSTCAMNGSCFCVGDTLVSPQHWHWLKPTGKEGCLNNPTNSWALSSRSNPPYVLLFDDTSEQYKMNSVQVLSENPLQIQLNSVCGGSVQLKRQPVCFDVSRNGTMFCLCYGIIAAVYQLKKKETSVVCEHIVNAETSLCSDETVHDVHFITLEKQELILLLNLHLETKYSNYSLSICDHHDGMHKKSKKTVVRREMCRTFTVHPEGIVWLGFNGGQVVPKDLKQLTCENKRKCRH